MQISSKLFHCRSGKLIWIYRQFMETWYLFTFILEISDKGVYQYRWFDNIFSIIFSKHYIDVKLTPDSKRLFQYDDWNNTPTFPRT